MFLRWVLKCSCRYDACKNRSYGENKGKQGRKAKTEQFAPPHFGNCWEHLDHFLKLKLCVWYLVSKLGKSGVHRFKRCLIWSWNEEVMAVWRWLCKAKRECCSRTPFCYCWTRFWSTFWSSNYAYHISFWSLGSQESSASNGVRFGFETKKLSPFERIQFCIWACE